MAGDNMDERTTQVGRLKRVKLEDRSFWLWFCVDCNRHFGQLNIPADLPSVIDARVLCRDQVILVCPYCIADQKGNP